MIKVSDILCLHFYDYKAVFTGSEGNLRYHIVKLEKEKEDGEKEASLQVIIWKGPYSFDYTPEEKTTREFPFTREGEQEAVDWLNEESKIYEKMTIEY